MKIVALGLCVLLLGTACAKWPEVPHSETAVILQMSFVAGQPYNGSGVGMTMKGNLSITSVSGHTEDTYKVLVQLPSDVEAVEVTKEQFAKMHVGDKITLHWTEYPGHEWANTPPTL